MNISKLFKDASFYTISSLLIKVSGFFLLPLYTSFLTTEDYGVTNLVSSFNGVAIYVVAFSLFISITRYLPTFQDQQEKKREFISTIIIFVFCSSLIYIGIFFALSRFIAKMFFEGISFYPNLAISAVLLSFTCLYEIHQRVLLGLQQTKKLAIRNIIVFAFNLLSNIFFVVIMKLGATGVLLSNLITYILYSVYMMFDLIRHKMFCLCFRTTVLISTLNYSIPLLPHNLSSHIATWFSRYILNITTSLSTVGLFSVATQFSSIIELVQVNANNTYMPELFKTLERNESNCQKKLSKTISLFLLIYNTVFLLIGLFSQEAIIIMTSINYRPAWTIVPLLALANGVKSLYYVYLGIIMYYKELTKKLFFASLTGSLANILFNFVLSNVLSLGVFGPALSLLLSNIVLVLIALIISKEHVSVYDNYLSMYASVALTTIVLAIGIMPSYIWFVDSFSILNVAYKIIVFVVYVISVYYFFVKKMRISLRNQFRKPRRL